MAAEGADAALVEKFVSITGAPESKAHALLNAYNGNLEMAIGVYLEDGHAETQPYESQMKNPDAGEDNVRAPIPQTRGVLIEGPYRANRPRRRGNQSVFDAFRDFQAEAREQELELSGRTRNSKRKTLQDLFKPPLDIMHKGTFDTAKVAGEQEGRWLMVNIQDSKEFNCQKLNRDVWSNDAVRNIVTNHFILWQVYHDSDDGDRYCQFYHVLKYPHLAILDPRTGEKMVEWDGVDAQTFCENAAEFLSHHSLGNNTPACLSPLAKRRKRESIIDASEDSQLEAAIAASLQEVSAEPCLGETFDHEKVDTGDDDDDSLTEFTDSESDTENISKTLVNQRDKIEKNNDNEKVPKPYRHDVSENKAKKAKEDCKRNNATTKEKKDDDDRLHKDETDIGSSEALHNGQVGSSLINKPQAYVMTVHCFQRSNAFLMLRFPNGERKQKLFPADASILDLVKYVQTQGFSNERYELVTNFPRKQLSYMNSDLTLKDAGLFPRETVFIQER